MLTHRYGCTGALDRAFSCFPACIFRLDLDNISLKMGEKSQIFQTCSVCKSHYVILCCSGWFFLSWGEGGTCSLYDCAKGLGTFNPLLFSGLGLGCHPKILGCSGKQESPPFAWMPEMFGVQKKKTAMIFGKDLRQTLFNKGHSDK